MPKQKVLIFLDIDGVFSTENAIEKGWQDWEIIEYELGKI